MASRKYQKEAEDKPVYHSLQFMWRVDKITFPRGDTNKHDSLIVHTRFTFHPSTPP